MQAEGAPLLRSALVVAILLSFLAIHRAEGSWETPSGTRIDEAAAVQAITNAQAAKDQLDRLMRELDELNNKIMRAHYEASGAHNDVDRVDAEARLEQLRHERYELTRRVTATRPLAHDGRVPCSHFVQQPTEYAAAAPRYPRPPQARYSSRLR